MSTQLTRNVFRPREGAVLDLKSLQALAEAPGETLGAWLASRWPAVNGLILEGLDLQGEPAPGGPPGTVRPDAMTGGALITPGRAVLPGRNGQLHLVRIREAIHCPWPDSTGPRVRGSLVLFIAETADAHEAGLAVAREEIQVQLGFVRPESATQEHLLPVAAAVGNGQDWACDVRRIMHPEHQAVQAILRHFKKLEQSVWKAEPEGSVWDRQILGRSWVRYQTVAAAVIQSARLQMATQAMTTLERVRLMVELRKQLERSVERTATELLQLIGPAEGAGPYRDVAGTGR